MATNPLFGKGDRRSRGRQGQRRGASPGQARSVSRKRLRQKIRAKCLQFKAEELGVSVHRLPAILQGEVNKVVKQKPVFESDVPSWPNC